MGKLHLMDGTCHGRITPTMCIYKYLRVIFSTKALKLSLKYKIALWKCSCRCCTRSVELTRATKVKAPCMDSKINR